MSAGFPPGFGAPGAPPGFAPAAAPPGYAAASPQTDFVLDIPPDPTWQPIESSDTLENDGFYQCRIKSEKIYNDEGKLQIILTLEIQDQDARGKLIASFLDDPRQTKGDTWWKWRGIIRSIMGTVQSGQQGMRYQNGMFTNQICYVKTGAYNDKKGNMRTGVSGWSTKDEWEEAYKRGGHRWPAKVSVAQAPGVGALPGGSGGLPGAPAVGLPGVAAMPGLPGAPLAPGVPTPGAAPMQQAPANPFAAAPPAASAPPQQNPFGAPPAPTAPPPAQVGFGFGAPSPAAAAPPAPIPFPPPANGVPQPTAAGVAMTFPGSGPQPPR